MTTRAEAAPQAGAVLARLCTRSTPARARQARQQRLLAHTHCTRRRAFTGTVTAGSSSPHGPLRGGCLAVDERREAHARRRLLDERGDQLARGDLHPAGLAGHEEDQVQADVHSRGQGSAQALTARAPGIRSRERRPTMLAWPPRSMSYLLAYNHWDLTRAACAICGRRRSRTARSSSTTGRTDRHTRGPAPRVARR